MCPQSESEVKVRVHVPAFRSLRALPPPLLLVTSHTLPGNIDPTGEVF